MEEKKLDLNSIIGFVLLSGILMWMLYSNAPTPEEQEAKAKQEQVEKQKAAATKSNEVAPVVTNDSLQMKLLKRNLVPLLTLHHFH